MTFEEWQDKDWRVSKWMNDQYALHAPSCNYIFNKHDLLQLYHNIGAVAEHLYDQEFYYIHDGNIFMRTGEQLFGVIEDCEELNRLYEENQKLKKERRDFLTNLDYLEQAIIHVQAEFLDNKDVQKAIELIAVRKRQLKGEP